MMGGQPSPNAVCCGMTTFRAVVLACLLPMSALAAVPEGSSPELRRAARAYASDMVQCFGKAHKKAPGARGSVTISFDVAAEYAVSTQAIADTVGIPKLRRCIERRTKKWFFETVADGTYTWQFDFRVGTDARDES